jgi:hypothetical protein
MLNVTVEWVTLLLCILEILDSSLGPETGYPDRGFPQALKENVGMLSFTSFPVSYSLIIPPFCAIEFKLLTASFINCK